MRSLLQQWTKQCVGLLFLIPSLLSAAPVDGVFTYRQPDGSALKVRVKGDEFFAEEMTLDGQRVIQDPVTRFWCYAKLSADGSDLESTGLVASEHSSRAFSSVESAPSSFHIKTPRAYRQRVDQANRTRLGRDHHGRMLPQLIGAIQPAPGSGMASLVQPVASSTLGVKHGLTLLIRFPDRAEDVTLSRTQVDNFCNQTSPHYTEFGNNGSVSEYYTVVSGGKLTYTNTVSDYYTAKNPRSYYTDPSISFGTRSAEVISEALDALEASGFDFHSVDGDGDGAIDAVNCFYAGPTVNTWSAGLWPHASTLSWQSVKTGIGTAGYQISNMDNYLQLGTFCHENGHMLCGFPDVYDYDGDSSGGAGAFDLMDLGCFGVNPCAPDGYLRYKAGWGSAEALGLGVNASKTLTAENGGLLANQFFIFSNPDAQEFFLIENIYKNGHNSNLQTGGIAVWHVDELGGHNNQNYTHQGAHSNYSIALIQADNQRHFERNFNVADQQDLFYSGNAASGYINEFSDSSDSGPYDNNAHWWSGTNSGLKLSGFSSQGNTMSFIVQTPVAPTTYTISVSSGTGGGISPSANVSVVQGSNATFTIQADYSYTINTVTVDGTNIGAVSSYTFSNVTAPHTISATFNAPPVGPAGYAWCAPENGSFTLGWSGSIDVAYGANGSFNYLYSKTGTITFNNATFDDPIPGVLKAGFYRMSAPPQYTLTASAGAGGTISPSGSVKVTQGYPQTFTITANAGYIISAVIVDGASVGVVGSYSFYNVTAAHTISASFSALVVGPAGYTWCASENGSFTLPGTCDVAYGANGSFNYLYGQTGTITFNNGTFKDPISGVVKAGFYRTSAVPQYSLTASAGTNGAISPSGSVTVNQGASQTFTFTPNAGYTMSAVTVDGASVTAGASYTFTNVTANHTLGVTFTLIPVSSNLALSRPASASSMETSAFSADLAVDGNPGTRWSSAFADPSWIAVDLGTAMSVSKVVLNWEAAYGKTYQLQTSTDGSNWTTVFTQPSGSGGLETDSFSAVMARYVRMYGTARGTQWGYSLLEFEVYGQ